MRYRLHFLDTLTPEDKEQTGAALGKHSLTRRRKENFPEAGSGKLTVSANKGRRKTHYQDTKQQRIRQQEIKMTMSEE